MWQATHAPLLRALGATTPADLHPLRGLSQEELFGRDSPFPARAQDQMWVALNRPEVAEALGAARTHPHRAGTHGGKDEL